MPDSVIVDLKQQGVKDLIDNLGLASKGLTELDKGLIEANKQLLKLEQGSEDFKKLSKEINAANTAITAYGQSTDTLKKELRETTNEIGNLDRAIKALEKTNQTGTDSYKNLVKEQDNLKKKAGELKDTINDLNEEIKTSGSDTKNLDKALRAIGAVAAGYQVAQGALALFGSENKKFEQALLKLNAVMAITNGLQQIQAELSRKDSLLTQAASVVKRGYASAVTFATGATTAFGVAIRALGLGLFIGAVALLVTNWEKLKEAISGAVSETDKLIKAKEKALAQSQRAVDSLEQELKFQVAIGKLTEKQALEKSITAKKEAELAAFQLQSAQLKKFAELQKASKEFYEETTALSQDGASSSRLVAKATQKQVNDQAEAWKKAKVAYQELVISRIEDEKKLEKLNKSDKSNTKDKVKTEKELYIDLAKLSKENLARVLKDLNEENQLYNKFREQRQKQEELSLQNQKRLEEERNRIILDRNESNQKLRLDANQKLQDDLADQNRQRQQEELDAEQAHAEKLANIFTVLSAAIDATNEIASGIINVRAENELKILEDKRKQGLITEKQFEKESAKIKNEAAEKQRAADIAIATAKIPLIVLQAYTSAPPPFSFILAGIAGALALAQVAILASSPLPKFKDGGKVSEKLGLIKGKSHQQGGVPIEVEGDEYVMPVKETRENLDALKAIHKGKFKELYIPKSQLIQPDIFANIPNPATIDSSIFMDKDDYSSINSRLDKVASELWWLTNETKKGNKLREKGTDKMVKAVQSKSKRYV